MDKKTESEAANMEALKMRAEASRDHAKAAIIDADARKLEAQMGLEQARNQANMFQVLMAHQRGPATRGAYANVHSVEANLALNPFAPHGTTSDEMILQSALQASMGGAGAGVGTKRKASSSSSSSSSSSAAYPSSSSAGSMDMM